MRSIKVNVRAALVCLLVVVGTAAGGTSPAQAATLSLRVLEAGGFQARGAAIAVDFAITCPPGGSASLSVEVTQRRADGALVKGSGSRGITCTGTAQTLRLAGVTVPTGATHPRPFAPGAALVTGILAHCDAEVTDCRTVSASRTVQTPRRLMDSARFTSPDLGFTLPSGASVEASGAGVIVRLPYRCTTGSGASLGATLFQRTPAGFVVSSGWNQALTCSSTRRSGVLSFHAQTAAWRSGAALIFVQGNVCKAASCVPAYAHRTLTLV